MSKRTLNWLEGLACAALLTVPLAARQPAAHNTMTQSRVAVQSAWPPEELTGKIMMVEPAQHLLVVQDASGVPFDLVITPGTQIRSGNQGLNLEELSSDMNKGVSLQFIPERRGDVARSIQVNG